MFRTCLRGGGDLWAAGAAYQGHLALLQLWTPGQHLGSTWAARRRRREDRGPGAPMALPLSLQALPQATEKQGAADSRRGERPMAGPRPGAAQGKGLGHAQGAPQNGHSRWLVRELAAVLAEHRAGGMALLPPERLGVVLSR